jgi:hypothetical protein
VKFTNVDRLKHKIRALPSAVRHDIGGALVVSANEISALQRRFVPVEHGALAGTIRNHFEESRLRAVLEAGGPATTKPVRDGADVDYDYALGQEFGTQEMDANPFFFPGYRLGKKAAKRRITRAINAAAKRVAAAS